jgi:hypothetical protein
MGVRRGRRSKRRIISQIFIQKGLDLCKLFSRLKSWRRLLERIIDGLGGFRGWDDGV